VVTSHLLALQFGLDTLAIRSVADHRKDRSDAVDELARQEPRVRTIASRAPRNVSEHSPACADSARRSPTRSARRSWRKSPAVASRGVLG
jgi:hypothetical protein